MSRQERKEDSRRRILEAARSLFKELGYQKVTVAAVMRAAGLTHGAFYAHFPSKQALHAAALAEIRFADDLRQAVRDSDDPLATLIEGYLSEPHWRDRQGGCLLAAVAGEAVMGQDTAEEVIGRGILDLRADLQTLGLDAATAGALVSVLVGGLMIARAVPDATAARDRLRDARLAAYRVIGRSV